jgi:hypothetical protein
MTTSTFRRLLGGLFGAPNLAGNSKQTEPFTSARAEPAPVVVGQGSPNERYVMIAGEAMLFRDEGDVVVQFHPAFDFELRETAVGMKLIPALEPHWAVLQEHRGALTDAIATAIKSVRRSENEPASVAPSSSAPQRQRSQRAQSNDAVIMDGEVREAEPVASAAAARRPERPRYGVVKEWGEKEFPDGKRPGKTYESFCLTLVNRGEIVVLQGEGLRDAIAEACCKVGDNVEVQRLGKTKVPAVDGRGQPKLDSSGAQILWDKWLWSINKKL